jgi:hypothetical protein
MVAGGEVTTDVEATLIELEEKKSFDSFMVLYGRTKQYTL